MHRLAVSLILGIAAAGCGSELQGDATNHDAPPFPTADAGVDAAGCGSEELCNGRDDDCDAEIDEGSQCLHEVECVVFDDGFANPSAPADAIYTPGAGQLCRPEVQGQTCRRWFGRCRAVASSDGHAHAVAFRVFDDNYTNVAGPSEAIYVRGPGQVCIPGGAEGVCRTWFGRAESDVVNGHKHNVECQLFEGDYASETSLSDAITTPGPEQMCQRGGECRRWFGRCRTVDTVAVP